MGGSDSSPLAVVTGGASGIGAACATLLTARGWRVVVADIAERAGAAVAERIGGHFVLLDVTDEAALDAAAERIVQSHGPVAGLVTSAGIIQRPVPPEELSMEDWDRVVAVDQRGTYVSCLAFGRRMTAAGAGSIVNIASVAGQRAMPLQAYNPAKAAVIAMTANLAVSWGAKGVRVNSVSPGFTLTPAIRDAIEKGERDVSRIEADTAMGRLVDPAEVAAAVSFLLSDEASAITGTDLVVDCGWMVAASRSTYGRAAFEAK
jgi:NAD(P)-dependent dehydrogenase (short-subunit alcohol dehydrogenase family)